MVTASPTSAAASATMTAERLRGLLKRAGNAVDEREIALVALQLVSHLLMEATQALVEGIRRQRAYRETRRSCYGSRQPLAGSQGEPQALTVCQR